MKTIFINFFLALVILGSTTLTAQTTSIPDSNFENYLETHDMNGNLVDVGNPNSMGNGIFNDGLVFTANIKSVISLDVKRQAIKDLTGIADFVTLQLLECGGNQLTNLNLSNNTNLVQLGCGKNNLSILDVSSNTKLQGLVCSENRLTNLNLSSNLALRDLICDYNQLMYLGLSTNNNLARISCRYNNLRGLNIKNGNNTNMTTFLANNNSSLTCIEVDSETYMNTKFASAKDVTASYSENCSPVSTTTSIPNANFENYLETHDANGNTVALGSSNSMGNGIENDNLVFTDRISSVTRLDVSRQSISDLTGIADFTTLELLFCYRNKLTSLDISKNTALKELYCYTNQLTSLDVSKNTALKELYCYTNQLTSLDVSKNTALKKLYCHTNQLTSLNLKNSNNNLLTEFNTIFNTNLACIEVSDVGYMNTKFASAKNATASYSENCSPVPATTSIPDANFENYLETHDANGNTVALGSSNSMGNGIAGDNLVFTDKISSVTSLSVSDRSISDLTGIADFTTLEILYCHTNQLTSLDVSKNTALKKLHCYTNQLTSLDVSKNTQLQSIGCGSNQLTSLDVSNNTALKELYCYTNQLTSLDVSKNTALKKLHCYTNQLTSLDVSNNTQLESIGCSNNQLTSLDVSKNTQLELIGCSRNKLTSLDVPKNTALKYLYCYTNQLTSLDVSKNTALEKLHCYTNQLTSLDVSKNTALEKLHCYTNQLTSLDVSKNTALKELYCSSNQLRSLNLTNSNNNLLTGFNAGFNTNLACIEVSDVGYMNTNFGSSKDATASYSLDCNDSLSTNEVNVQDLKVTSNNGKIFVNFTDAVLDVFNMAGQQVPNNDLKGIYIVKVTTNKNHYRKVIVVE